MKQSEALHHLQQLIHAIQKLRSIMAEDGIITDAPTNDPLSLMHMTTEQAAQCWKYVWGEKSILPVLVKVVDKAEETDQLAPMDFYNMIYVATGLEPLLAVAVAIIGDTDFPEETDLQWLRGWDEE